MTGEVSNTDYLFIVAAVSGWDIWHSSKMAPVFMAGRLFDFCLLFVICSFLCCPDVYVLFTYIREQLNILSEELEAGKIGRCEDLSEFDEGYIRINEALVGCSWSVVVSIYQK